jgi:hypothetical protein
VVGYDSGDLEGAYASAVQVATNVCRYCMAQENNLPITVYTHPEGMAFRDLWQRLKHFD